jgi:hypothetical protein
MPALAVLVLLITQSDSAALLSRARRAQADFERTRLFLLPAGFAHSGERCDARIGRFCYWTDGGDSHVPPEPTQIGAARTRLLAVLDSAAQAVPGDAWVVGQRVRYLLEAGRPLDAVVAAQDCRAVLWWCAALEGLAWHGAGDTETAERLFQAALELMPWDERCRWTDLSDLLEEPLRRRYRSLSCDGRTGFDARVWWLAQPLWSLAGNDRRTEHYARLTLARLLEHARSPYGLWGDDEREMTVRYGWPLVWERDDGGQGSTREPVAIGHEPEPSYHFVPDARTFDALSSGDEPPLQGIELKTALERYAPAYAARFSVLEPEFATFRRGESTLVVASYDVTEDTLYRHVTREAALVLARDEWSSPVVVRRPDATPSGVLVAEAPWQPALLSLELRAPEAGAAARVRERPPALVPSAGAVTLSGIVPFEPSDSLPPDLAAVLARAHIGGVGRGERIGLYWEAYGLARGEDISTAVTVTPQRHGWLRRMAATLRLAQRQESVRVEWREATRLEQGRAARALVLDLAGLTAGRYRIDIAVSPAGRATATTSRRLDVVER